MRGPTFLSGTIAHKAMDLFRTNYHWSKPIRSIGVRGANLVMADQNLQLDLFDEDPTMREHLEKTIDDIRRRFGPYSIQRCSMLNDRQLTGFNPKDDHVIHLPVLRK